MRTDINDIRQAVESLMEGIYVDGSQTDFTVQTIEGNPLENGDDSVALYMGDERNWNIVNQRFDEMPDVWMTFHIIIDEQDLGTISVMTHDDSGYAEALGYIEIDTSECRNDTEVIMVEEEQLYAGLRGRTLDYVKRVMFNGNAD